MPPITNVSTKLFYMSGIVAYRPFYSTEIIVQLFQNSKKCFTFISGSWKLHQIVYSINLKMISFWFKCHNKAETYFIQYWPYGARCFSFFSRWLTNLRHTNICHMHIFIQTYILLHYTPYNSQFNCERTRFYATYRYSRLYLFVLVDLQCSMLDHYFSGICIRFSI